MTTTAQELLDDPWLGIDPPNGVISALNGKSMDDLAHFRIGNDDIQNLIIKVYGNGSKAATTVQQNLRSFVTNAEFEDSIDKPNTFTLTVHDPDWELLNMGVTSVPMDINPGKLPHIWYRLDSYDVNDDDITLVFMTRNAVLMSRHKRPFKISRNKATRAEFIKMMMSKVKLVKIKLYCPELHKKQKIAKYSSDAERKKAHDSSSGFTKSDKITIKHRPANESQKKVVGKVIEAGVDMHMPGLVIVSAVMCIIQESTASENPQPPNPPYVGAFQQNRAMGWPGTGDAYKDAKGYYTPALKRYNQHKDDETLGQLVAHVQGVVGSTNPLNAGYAGETDRWRDEAQHAVNAFGGIDVNDPGSSSVSSTYRKKYEYMVGEPDGPKSENYLGAAYRLAEQVNWSFYWVKDVAHYISQEDLFKAKARIRLRRFYDGVEGISFGWDRMQKVNTMTLQVRMERWVCPIGTVVIFDEGGPDVRGRWLVTNIRRSMFDALGQITLAKPINEKLEPAADTATRTTDSQSDTTAMQIGDLAYPLAERGTFLGGPADHAKRAFGNWQSDNADDIGVPMGTDVFCVDDGTVVRLGGSWNGGQGNPDGFNFTFKQTHGTSWFYTHLKHRESFQVGQKVRKGQLIGKSGAANGVEHLHIGCEHGDPTKLLGWDDPSSIGATPRPTDASPNPKYGRPNTP